MAWMIEPLPTSGARFEAALAVYREAFSRPPYSDSERVNEVRARVASQHRRRAGFRAFCAVHADGRVLGMTYGYRSEPGQWWHEAVAAVIGPEDYAAWLSDAYELAEVAVAPAFQSFGIGRALIDHLLSGVQERTCVLSTRSDSNAHRLYRRIGFQEITEMKFFTGGHPFYIMGRLLNPPAQASEDVTRRALGGILSGAAATG